MFTLLSDCAIRNHAESAVCVPAVQVQWEDEATSAFPYAQRSTDAIVLYKNLKIQFRKI